MGSLYQTNSPVSNNSKFWKNILIQNYSKIPENKLRQKFAIWALKWKKVKVTQPCPTLCDPMEYSSWNSPGQNTWVGSLSLLQGIFPTQGSNWGLLHCRRILYQLSYREAQEKDLFNQFSLNGLPHKVHCREITDQQNTSVLQGWEARDQNSELWEQLWLHRNPGMEGTREGGDEKLTLNGPPNSCLKL